MRHTDATKKKLSDMRRDKLNPFYGRKHSDETKRKIGIGARRINAQRQYDLDAMTVPLLDAHDLGYLAGIVDGEGSISIVRDRPRIAVYNSDGRLMDWLLEKVGGTVTWGADKRGRVPGHTWHLYAAKNVHQVCRLLWPSLLLKREMAEEVIVFLKNKYGERIHG